MSSGGGGGNIISKGIDKGREYLGKAKDKAIDARDLIAPGSGIPDAPDKDAAQTMEDIAAKEPDKERRRKQRMAALMAQGRQGTILSGTTGTMINNSVGGGGKQMVGA